MSEFLRGEDFLPITPKQSANTHWNALLQIISEYEQLLDRQKAQITECLDQNVSKRIDLVKKFLEYKDSLKYEGQIVKKETLFLSTQKLKQFFSGYHEVIRQIIEKMFSNHQLLAQLIKSYSGSRKYKFADFCQNLSFTIYPPFIPYDGKAFMSSNFMGKQEKNNMMFIRAVIYNWNYSIDHCRPTHQTPLDDVIQGYFKNPEIMAYVEKITTKFLQKINQNRLDVFAFDEEAIKNQLETKKLITMSQIPPNKEKESIIQMFRSWRKKGKDDMALGVSMQKVNSQDHDSEEIERKQILQIMRKRQMPLISIISSTVEQILIEEPPLLLCQMLGIFHQSLLLKHKQTHGFKKMKLNENSSDPENILKHYCYFLLTNFILSELHNKFTISYQGYSRNMNHADLQNISQIIRAISSIFQGYQPNSQKYKNLASNLRDYRKDVALFYTRILQRAFFNRSDIEDLLPCRLDQIKEQDSMNGQQDTKSASEELSTMLYQYYQGTIILSFNDVKILVDILRQGIGYLQALGSSFLSTKSQCSEGSSDRQRMNSIQIQEDLASRIQSDLQLSQQARSLCFLEKTQNSTLFGSSRRVDFMHKTFDPENLFFVFRSSSQSLRDIIGVYTGSQSPLKNLPLITNTLLHESNLTVNQTLEVTQSLQIVKRLPFREMKCYLDRLATRYNKLYIKDSSKIQEQFRASLLSSLRESLSRKAVVLSSKQNFTKKIDFYHKLMEYYKSELKSSQFYQNICQNFIKNLKLKVYVNIESHLFKLHSHHNDMKGLKVGSLMVSNDFDKKSAKSSDDFMMRNSYKSFESIPDFLKTITNHPITYAALLKGRKMEEFNSFFAKFCELVVGHTEEFLAQKVILQNLDKQKFAKVVVSKLQNRIFFKICIEKNEKNEKIIDQDDRKLIAAQKLVNKKEFYQRDLWELKLERDFLLAEGILKFKKIVQSQSIQKKLIHFEEFFKVILTIVGFSMVKDKMGAEIINPIMQYIILECPPMSHYQTLYALQCLKWRQNPQTNYSLTLYQSSLTYIIQTMAKDHPIKN